MILFVSKSESISFSHDGRKKGLAPFRMKIGENDLVLTLEQMEIISAQSRWVLQDWDIVSDEKEGA